MNSPQPNTAVDPLKKAMRSAMINLLADDPGAQAQVSTLLQAGATVDQEVGTRIMRSVAMDIMVEKPGVMEKARFLLSNGIEADPAALNGSMRSALMGFMVNNPKASGQIANLLEVGAKVDVDYGKRLLRTAAQDVALGNAGAAEKVEFLTALIANHSEPTPPQRSAEQLASLGDRMTTLLGAPTSSQPRATSTLRP